MKLKKFFEYILNGLALIVAIPFAILYFIASMFWVFFGTTIIAFIILMLLGATDNECITYASSLGLLITIIKKVNDESKK